MKYLFCLLLVICSLLTKAQSPGLVNPDPQKQTFIVEASCGQCNFDLSGKGCELAIRMDGKAYFVTGTDIDDHGDAHAHDGFCESIRTAEVQGEVVGDKFNVSFFRLQKVGQNKNPEKQ